MSRPAAAAATGYEPEKLDGAIQRHLDVAESSVRSAQVLGKRVEEALKLLESHQLGGGANAAAAIAEAEALTGLFGRLTKSTLDLVKAADELSRLRSFVAGGADSRPDLGELSDSALAQHLIEVIVANPALAKQVVEALEHRVAQVGA